jgi:hypothetical protein
MGATVETLLVSADDDGDGEGNGPGHLQMQSGDIVPRHSRLSSGRSRAKYPPLSIGPFY